MKKIYAIYHEYYAKSKPILLSFILLAVLYKVFFLLCPLVLSWLIDAAVDKDMDAFWRYLVWAICLEPAFMIVFSLRVYISGKIEIDATALLKEKIISRLPVLQHEALQKTTLGHVLQIVSDDLESAESLVINYLVSFILEVIFFVIMLAIVWHINFRVFLVIVFVIPPLAFISKLMVPIIQKLQQESIEKTETVKDLTDEMFSGSLIIKLANAYAFINAKIKAIVADYRQAKMRYMKKDTIYDYLLVTGFLNMGNLAIHIVGVFLIVQGNITVGALTVLGIYFSHSWNSFEFFMSFYRDWKVKMVSVDRINSFFALPVEVCEGEIAEEFACLEMNNISYEIDGQKILSDVSFSVNKGDKILITGDNGSGKSTLVRLLVGLMSPSGGCIYYNGKDISGYNLHSLRERVCYIPAEPYIFSGGLEDNLFTELGNGDVAPSVGGDGNRPAFVGMVSALSAKYDDIAKEGGNLSSGEKKRLQLASGLLSQSDIYILDEPLNFVDKASKDEIVETIHREFGDKTLIVISHESVPFEFCEVNYHMKDGRLMRS